MTPAGLLSAYTSRGSGATAPPSTRTSLDSSTSRAGSVTVAPPTLTRPFAISFSAARREATPEWARYLASLIAPTSVAHGGDEKQLLPDIEPALPPEVKTYGSGAVVRNADGGSTILALDSDRRFKFVTSFADPDPPTSPLKDADESMSRVIGAIRRDSCPDITTWSLTFSNLRGKRFCGARPIRELHAALDREYTASPTALGGDGTFAFYGLWVKPHYFTLVFLASEKGPYWFVTSVRT